MKAKTWYFITLLICISWLIYTYNLIVIPIDPGDGLMHFYISQASWTQPHLFLHHWGKPLFILLSSPFAQLGYVGMFTFNLIAYAATCLIALRIFINLKVNLFLAALLPVFLLLSNDFATTIFAGLTECLFNLFVMLAFLFLIEKKWSLFALIISLTPFLRSEGQLVMLIALSLILVYRQWKIIPLLFIFPLIYFLSGFYVYGDFWWYFTKSSYQFSNNIYGHGTWWHYFEKRENYLGEYGFKLIVFAFIALLLLLSRKKWTKIKFTELFFSSGVFIGIVLFHSYLWSYGKYGSIGLTRITTQGLPLFFLISLYYIGTLFSKINLVFVAFISIGTFVFLTNRRFDTLDFFTHQKPFEKQIMAAGDFLKINKSKLKKIHYHHPLIAFQLGYNPFIDSNKIHFYYGHNFENEFNSIIKKGDILVWDSQFGPVEAGMPLWKVKNCKQLSQVAEFSYINEISKVQGALIFQNEKLGSKSEKEIPIRKNEKIIFNKNEEFKDLFQTNVILEQKTYRLKLNSSEVTETYLVCTNSNNSHYQARKISKGENVLEFILLSNEQYKIYFWNPSKNKTIISINLFSKVEKKYPKLKF